VLTQTDMLRVLHADDDETFRLLVENLVQRDPSLSERCDLRFVEDGTLALSYLRGEGAYADRAAHPAPHLVLLDQRMTRMDGLETLREIRADRAFDHIPIFLLSTSAEEFMDREGGDHPGAFCIRKPLDFSELGPMLTTLVDLAINVLELPRRHPV